MESKRRAFLTPCGCSPPEYGYLGDGYRPDCCNPYHRIGDEVEDDTGSLASYFDSWTPFGAPLTTYEVKPPWRWGIAIRRVPVGGLERERLRGRHDMEPELYAFQPLEVKF